jgi:hypothetical protein
MKILGLRSHHFAITLQYPSNYNPKPIILRRKTHGFAAQYAGFCGPKCSILVGGGIFIAKQNKLKEKAAKKLRIVSIRQFCPQPQILIKTIYPMVPPAIDNII